VDERNEPMWYVALSPGAEEKEAPFALGGDPREPPPEEADVGGDGLRELRDVERERDLGAGEMATCGGDGGDMTPSCTGGEEEEVDDEEAEEVAAVWTEAEE
jgi:hypothetical protein